MVGEWDPQYREPNPMSILPAGGDWAPISQQPKDVTLADAWDVNGPVIRDALTGALNASQDPAFWQNAANQYAGAMIGGTSGPRPSAIASRIGTYAAKMGYSVAPSSSQISRSSYLELNHDLIPGDTIKVRVSDHNLPPSYGSPGDFDVHSGAPREESVDWANTVKALADRIGANVPPSVASVLTRSQSAAVAADAAERARMMSSPAYQEAILARAYPEAWANALAQTGPSRSIARRQIAATYEAENPGQFSWVPYLQP
jgi:hypothetical protein